MGPFLPALRSVAVALACVCATTAVRVNGAESAERIVPAPGASFQGIFAPGDIDSASFAEWSDGKERPMPAGQCDKSPAWVTVTTTGVPAYSGIAFGSAPAPGTHHLRLGFNRPLPVGAVLVSGGGTLSVLRGDAPYPGDLNNEKHWLPAERLGASGAKSTEPIGRGEYGLWTLPAGTLTRALRFTARSKPIDLKYEGWLGGVLVSSERLVNFAPFATIATKTNNHVAERIINGQHDGSDGWETRERKLKSEPSKELVVSASNAEWIVLTWPTEVKLSGLVALWAGFDSVEVLRYAGPEDRHPRDARDADWKPVSVFKGLQHGYAVQL